MKNDSTSTIRHKIISKYFEKNIQKDLPKSTDINVLLNRVKNNQKNESRRKIYFSAVASAGLFLFGLILGPIFYSVFSGGVVSNMTSSYALIIVAGLLVGFGTKIGSGCTSGHGICGISRFSLRSIIATISFIITGVLTVFIFGA